MLVRKVRGEDKVSKITLLAAEVAVARKMGVSVEKYVAARLVQIAKKRRWKWFFNKEKKHERTKHLGESIGLAQASDDSKTA